MLLNPRLITIGYWKDWKDTDSQETQRLFARSAHCWHLLDKIHSTGYKLRGLKEGFMTHSASQLFCSLYSQTWQQDIENCTKNTYNNSLRAWDVISIFMRLFTNEITYAEFGKAYKYTTLTMSFYGRNSRSSMLVCSSEFSTRPCFMQGSNGNVSPSVLHKFLVTLWKESYSYTFCFI